MEKVLCTLNGATLSFNKATGELVSLSGDSCGELIKNGSGLIDVAWPLQYDYEILRASADGKFYSSAPRIETDTGSVCITWEKLPQNIDTKEQERLEGGVWAQVRFWEEKDGISIGMSCKVRNNSNTEVRQIVFPDFQGLEATDGDNTRFTTLGASNKPFIELADTPDNRKTFFALSPPISGKMYQGGGYFDKDGMIGRWYNVGGLKGGLCVFRKHWGWGPDVPTEMGRADAVWLKLNNKAHTLRVANLHNVSLKHGEEYDSGEYIITPHAGGWVRGIAPYTAWVNANMKRAVKQPDQIKRALGYRTIWMTEQYPSDPDAIKYTFDDLPEVAKDMKEHGLYELSIWGYTDSMLPYTKQSFCKELGGFEKWKHNVDIVHRMGVNVAPFVSFISLWHTTGERYGLSLGGADQGWSQNIKGIPVFQASYMEKYRCSVISDQTLPLWKEDVTTSLRFLRDEAGTPSIGWDQVILSPEPDTLVDIIKNYRKETTELHPNATFYGESTFYFEEDVNFLDYTWDWEYWPGVGDCRAYSHVIRTTRPNINIDNSPLHAKYSFMDNMIMNVIPSKVEDVNGSAYIYEYPELSATLKALAALRERFLSYFVEGDILGDCILANESVDARVTAFEYNGSVVIFAIKLTDDDIELDIDLEPFVGTNERSLTLYDINGRVVSSYAVENAKLKITVKGAAEDLYAIEIQ